VDWNSLKSHLSELLKSCPVDYVDIRIQESEKNSFRFRGPELESIEDTISFGGGVRALTNGGWGFASFNSPDQIDDRVKQACDMSKVAGKLRDESVKLADVEPVTDTIQPPTVWDPMTVDLSDKIAKFKEYNSMILEYGEDIISSDVVYGDVRSRTLFINNEGACIDQTKLDLSGAIVAIATRGNDTQVGTVGFGSSTDYGVTQGLENEVNEACETACTLLDAPAPEGGSYTVVASPRMAGIFAHEAFGHLSEADDLMEKPRMRQMMRLGRRFGNETLNIYDTGLTEGARGYMLYDDEGVQTERTDLIREGVLVGRLHSRQSAATMGEDPTGNARALSYRFPPMCRMRNTCIEAGEASFNDMLQGIDKGLYVVTPQGGQTDDEMFTFMAGKSYLIEDGKLGPMIKDVTLTGNVFHTLQNIDMVGRDVLQWETAGGCGKGEQSPLPTSEWAPHIRIQDVVVGGER